MTTLDSPFQDNNSFEKNAASLEILSKIEIVSFEWAVLNLLGKILLLLVNIRFCSSAQTWKNLQAVLPDILSEITLI